MRVSDWAQRHEAWVHVDGAFGLWAATAPRYKHLTAGLARAHSWATDGHKWLNVPYDCGIALVRDPDALCAAMAMTAAYLPPSGLRDPMHYGPDASQRARAVDVWAALKHLGRTGVCRSRIALLQTCRAVRRRTAGRRTRSAERRRSESGIGRVRRRGNHVARDRRVAARRHVLVRRKPLARSDRDAHQRVFVGHLQRGRRSRTCSDVTVRAR